MKIAIIIPDDFSIVWFSETLVKKLLIDNEVTAICDIHNGYESEYYLKIMKEWGVEHEYVKFYRFMNPLKDLLYIKNLYKILKKRKFDKVINIATKPNLFGSIAARLAGVKNITTCVWGLGLSFSDSRTIKAFILRLVASQLYKHSFKQSKKVWFTNKNDLEYFTSRAMIDESKTYLTRNYVNTKQFSPDCVSTVNSLKLKMDLGFLPKDKVVICLARMSWAKGIKEFCEASDILKDENIKFLLVGPVDEGSSDSVPISYLEKYNSNNNFKWIGFRKDVKELYSISCLAVYPSFYREGGYPRGLTEPMSMQKPVITTDSKHCSAAVDHEISGLLVPIRNSIALADAIKRIVDDEELATSFGIQSRKKAQRELDEEVIIEGLVKSIF